MEFIVYADKTEDYTFDLTLLGYGADEAVPLYDVWQKQSVGTATGVLTTRIPSHGAKLFRLGNNEADAIQFVPVDGDSSDRQDDKSAAYEGLGSGEVSYDLSGLPITLPHAPVYIHQGKKVMR